MELTIRSGKWLGASIGEARFKSYKFFPFLSWRRREVTTTSGSTAVLIDLNKVVVGGIYEHSDSPNFSLPLMKRMTIRSSHDF